MAMRSQPFCGGLAKKVYPPRAPEPSWPRRKLKSVTRPFQFRSTPVETRLRPGRACRPDGGTSQKVGERNLTAPTISFFRHRPVRRDIRGGEIAFTNFL